MAHVGASSEIGVFTGGVVEFEVAADSVRKLISELEARYPGLGEFVERRMVVAIDGEIHQGAFEEALRADSEIYLMPKVGGG